MEALNAEIKCFAGFSRQNTAHETIYPSDGNMQTIECLYVFFDSLK